MKTKHENIDMRGMGGWAIYDNRGILGWGENVREAIDNYIVRRWIKGDGTSLRRQIRKNVHDGSMGLGLLTIPLRNALRNWDAHEFIEIGEHEGYPVLGTVDECPEEVITQRIAEMEAEVGDMHGLGGWAVYQRGEKIYAVGRNLREALEKYGNYTGRSMAKILTMIRDGQRSLGLVTPELYMDVERDRWTAEFISVGSISIYPVLSSVFRMQIDDSMEWVAYTKDAILSICPIYEIAMWSIRMHERISGVKNANAMIGRITPAMARRWQKGNTKEKQFQVRPGRMEGIPIVCTPEEFQEWMDRIEKEAPSDYVCWAIVDDEFGVLGFAQSPKEVFRSHQDKWFKFIHEDGARLGAMDAELAEKAKYEENVMIDELERRDGYSLLRLWRD